jgi:aspartate aminotransferase
MTYVRARPDDGPGGAVSSLAALPPSPTLATNERVQARIAAGAPVLHLAFGEAGLPVLPSVAVRLGAAAGANGYGPVAGSPAVREPDEVREHVARSRRLHRLVATAAHEQVTAAGALCRPPSGAFYLYPDLEPLRPALARRGVSTGAQLAALLLEQHDLAVLEGEAFGDDSGALRFRMATSLLYGADEAQRWEALRADDPVSLPWVAGALERLGATLRALAA